MLRGDLYLASDPALVEARVRARRLFARLNASDPGDGPGREALMRELLGRVGDGAWIEPPFYCDYGMQITLGAGAFVNFGAVFLDPAPITIGEQAQLGPGVQLLTADHPRDAAERAAGPELARPIVIGSRAWLGGGVIVGPGVTIGADSIVGAGSVVMRDVPAGVVAGGNPCRVIRRL
ncbi:MAG TPA: sugar O-acetyltransferase [Longimicrobiaceae bacterium]|jgi:maltose O-acetyltransferase|nr:sugar O-acetyltransferase [Longimicrobiaceae bacterium]